MTTRKLEGKVALVTGGSRGIGAAIVKGLAGSGAKVAFSYAKSKDKADSVVADVARTGHVAVAIRADSMVDAEVVALVARTVERFGALDILVNNAGIGSIGALSELPIEQIESMLTVNVRATVIATREALKHLPDGGRIINIGSIVAERTPYAGGSIYSLTKGAIAGFTRGLTRELAPRRITVNNVQPGPIETEGTKAEGPFAAILLNALALERFGHVEEVAAFVSYLSGPDAAFITGANLNIDGGFSA
jgi:3-oxoacyl-[acyl-carrier protein] reductase